MRAFLCAVGFLAMVPPADAQKQFGVACKGQETIKFDDAAPLAKPYSLNLSIDLLSGFYCYAECLPEQTYRISNGVSEPIMLANLDGDQPRRLSFDRKTAVLRDYQIIQALGRVERVAQATCKVAPFRKPAPTP